MIDDGALDAMLRRIGLVVGDLPSAVVDKVRAHVDGVEAPGPEANMNAAIRGWSTGPPEPTVDQDADEAVDPFDRVRMAVAEARGLPGHLVPLLQGETIAGLIVECDRFIAAAEPPTPVPAGPRGTRLELSATEHMNAELRRAVGRPDSF